MPTIMFSCSTSYAAVARHSVRDEFRRATSTAHRFFRLTPMPSRAGRQICGGYDQAPACNRMERALSASVTVQHILLEALQDAGTLSLHPASHCFPTMSLYQLTPFQVGQVYAHMHHQLTALQISRIIFKGDYVRRSSDYVCLV
jgi:hypothetical protein